MKITLMKKKHKQTNKVVSLLNYAWDKGGTTPRIPYLGATIYGDDRSGSYPDELHPR